MSLINQMLKDLEARRGIAAGDHLLDALSTQGRGAVHVGRVRLSWLLASTGMIVLLLGLVAYLLWLRPVGLPVLGTVAAAGQTGGAARVGTRRAVAGTAQASARRMSRHPGSTETSLLTDAGSGQVTPGRSAPGHTPAPAVVPIPAPPPAPPPAPSTGRAMAERRVAVDARLPALPSSSTHRTRVQPRRRVGTAPPHPLVSRPAHRVPVMPTLPGRGVNGGVVAGGVDKRQRPLTPAQQAALHYRRALVEFGQGRTAHGETLLRQALQRDPDYVAARGVLAGMLLRAGRLVEAGEVLREGLRRTPNHILFVRLYARVLLAQGQGAAAVRLLEQHRPSAGQALDYDALLAALYQRTGRYQQAVDLYRRLVATRPRRGAWWLGLGLALEGTGQPAQAREAYTEAVRTGTLDAASRAYVQRRLGVLGAS